MLGDTAIRHTGTIWAHSGPCNKNTLTTCQAPDAEKLEVVVEKLEFSMQDLGRLAAFMDGKFGRPVDQIKEWIAINSQGEAEAKAAYIKLDEGFYEEEEHYLPSLSAL